MDPGHLLPQEDWDKVSAEAERIAEIRERREAEEKNDASRQ